MTASIEQGRQTPNGARPRVRNPPPECAGKRAGAGGGAARSGRGEFATLWERGWRTRLSTQDIYYHDLTSCKEASSPLRHVPADPTTQRADHPPAHNNALAPALS